MIPRRFSRRTPGAPATNSASLTSDEGSGATPAHTLDAPDATVDRNDAPDAPDPRASADAAPWSGARWEYLVGYFARRGSELWFESSHSGKTSIRGRGARGYADLLNRLGDEGWELVHCDDTPPRTLVDAGAQSVYAWGDMIFKRPRAG